MCNGDADGEELPQVTTSHHQVNDYKRRKPDDISQWKWNCNPEAMVIIAKKGKDKHFSFFKESTTQKAGKCKCSPASRKTHPPSWKYKWVQRKIQKQIDLQQIQVFNLTFLSPYLWADWERGMEVCSRRIAPNDLIIKSCYFQLQQLLYSFSHSSYPMFLATSINKLQYSLWNLG